MTRGSVIIPSVILVAGARALAMSASSFRAGILRCSGTSPAFTIAGTPKGAASLRAMPHRAAAAARPRRRIDRIRSATSEFGTKRTSSDVRYPVANGAKRTSRGQTISLAIDPDRTFSRLDLGRKNAYARVEGIGGGIGNEATRVHHTDWRRAVRLLKRLFQRLLILGLGILSIWLIVFVIFETADRRLPWLLALGLTYGIAAYIVLPRAIRIGLKILQRKLVPSFTITGDGLPGDPVNLALIGTLPQLRIAFAALGWSEADRLSVASSWRMTRAFVFNSPYPTAPFSTLYLFGRGQDIGFQKAIDNSPRKRHHIRFWALSLTRAQDTWGAAGFWLNTDRPPDNEHVLWVGAGTRDTGLSLTRLSFQITHATDSDTNAERDYIIAELMKNRVIEAVKVVQSGQRLPAERVNHYTTDGEVMLASLVVNDA